MQSNFHSYYNKIKIKYGNQDAVKYPLLFQWSRSQDNNSIPSYHSSTIPEVMVTVYGGISPYNNWATIPTVTVAGVQLDFCLILYSRSRERTWSLGKRTKGVVTSLDFRAVGGWSFRGCETRRLSHFQLSTAAWV